MQGYSKYNIDEAWKYNAKLRLANAIIDNMMATLHTLGLYYVQ